MIPQLIGRVSTLALVMTALTAGHAHAQLRESSTQTLTAGDGSVFEVTTGFVQVPELRDPDGKALGLGGTGDRARSCKAASVTRLSNEVLAERCIRPVTPIWIGDTERLLLCGDAERRRRKPQASTVVVWPQGLGNGLMETGVLIGWQRVYLRLPAVILKDLAIVEYRVALERHRQAVDVD